MGRGMEDKVSLSKIVEYVRMTFEVLHLRQKLSHETYMENCRIVYVFPTVFYLIVPKTVGLYFSSPIRNGFLQEGVYFFDH